MSILNGDDGYDQEESFHDGNGAEAAMTHEELVALLTSERDFYMEESKKDKMH